MLLNRATTAFWIISQRKHIINASSSLFFYRGHDEHNVLPGAIKSKHQAFQDFHSGTNTTRELIQNQRCDHLLNKFDTVRPVTLHCHYPWEQATWVNIWTPGESCAFDFLSSEFYHTNFAWQ